MEYTAEITVKAHDALTEDVLFDVAEIGGVAVGKVGEFVLEATLTVKGKDVHEAATRAAAAIIAKVPGVAVAVEVMTTEEADRRLADRPRYMGVSEVAELLGVTKQRVSVLRRRHDFPAPLEDLSAGPIWRAGDLSSFVADWARKPGRPRKSLTN